MNKSTLVIVVLVIISFIPNFSIGGGGSEINIDDYAAEGYVAYIVNSVNEKSEDTNEDKEPNPDVNKCVCEGSGVITHGDGHTTPCPYHSKSEQPKVKPVDKQVLFFTMRGCGPCASFKASEIPSLKRSGWKVSESEDAMVRVVDIRKYPKLWAKYKSGNSVPQFCLIENGKKVKTINGFTSATKVANLYNKK